jgi:hypothetical protein
MLSQFCLSPPEYPMRPFEIIDEKEDVKSAQTIQSTPSINEVKSQSGLGQEDQFIDADVLKAYREAKKTRKKKIPLPGTKLLKQLQSLKI